jgi:hypothetical protein
VGFIFEFYSIIQFIGGIDSGLGWDDISKALNGHLWSAFAEPMKGL